MNAGPHMMTVSGRRFHFDNPDPDEIVLSDIAFALAHLNRFTGHAGTYSVATHSLNVLRCALDRGASGQEARAALMHDAHEAYVGDVSTPLKIAIGPAFAAIDRRAACAVADRFKFDPDLEIVRRADRMVTHAEALHFIGDEAKSWATEPWREFDPYRFRDQPDMSFLTACEQWGIR